MWKFFRIKQMIPASLDTSSWTHLSLLLLFSWFLIPLSLYLVHSPQTTGDLKSLTYNKCSIHIFVVQSLSRVQLFVTPWTAARQSSLSFTVSRSLLKLMSIELVMPSNHLVLCYPLLLMLSVFASIRVFSNELALRIRWPKYWSFSFSISPSNEYSRLISFRIDWFGLLDVQGTLKSLLQHHNLKESIFQERF